MSVSESLAPSQSPASTEIHEEETRMAIALTEYFQEQRMVYDQVHAYKIGANS